MVIRFAYPNYEKMYKYILYIIFIRQYCISYDAEDDDDDVNVNYFINNIMPVASMKIL